MKGFFQIFSVSFFAVLLWGCSNGGDVELGSLSEITFNAKHLSRGVLNQTTIDNGEGRVYVCGVQNNSTKIFNNVAITRDAATGK